MRIAITGANGFLGSALASKLAEEPQHQVTGLVRKVPTTEPPGICYRHIGDLSPQTEWQAAIDGMDVVIHAAARVHVMNESAEDALSEYRRVNVEGTLKLARQAVQAGVKRFIFISSIKVNGEHTEAGAPFTADATPRPVDPYGVSKMEAERGLYDIGEETGIEIVCIRPPLVYGPGVKANFLSMTRWLSRGVPLPLGSIGNQRSLVALDNLVDLIITCVTHPAAAGQTFLASDDEDLSTTQLLQRMGNALNKKACLLPIPPIVLKTGAQLAGKQGMAQRLLGNLQLDISKTKHHLDWKPPLSVDEGLRKTADWFLNNEKSR